MDYEAIEERALIYTEIEKELNDALKRLDLKEWRVEYKPEPMREWRGMVMYQEKLILISVKNREAAYRTLAHEIIELKIKAMVDAQNATINALIKALQQIFYREKERGIESLVPAVLELIKTSEKNTEKEGDGYV